MRSDFLAVDVFSQSLRLGIPDRAFEQRVEEAAVRRRGHALEALGAADVEVDRAVRRARRRHRVDGRASAPACRRPASRTPPRTLPVAVGAGSGRGRTPRRSRACRRSNWKLSGSKSRAGEVALASVPSLDDAERHLLVRDRAGRWCRGARTCRSLEVHLVVVEVEHRSPASWPSRRSRCRSAPRSVPSAIFLMPEWPCSGWPRERQRDAGRRGRPTVPSTVPSASTRLPVVNRR